MSGGSTASNSKHPQERMEGTHGCKGCRGGVLEPWDGGEQGQGWEGSRGIGTPRVRCSHCGFGLLKEQEPPSFQKIFGMQSRRIGSSALSHQLWVSHKEIIIKKKKTLE